MIRFATVWLALFWLWLLLVGQWDLREWIAAAVAATAAAALSEVAVRAAGVDVDVPLRWLAKAWSVPAMVVVDFGILVWALGRRRKGTFVRRPLPGDVSSPAVRAWLAIAATYSPNAYVVDVDAESGEVLVHDLVRNRASESPL